MIKEQNLHSFFHFQLYFEIVSWESVPVVLISSCGHKCTAVFSQSLIILLIQPSPDQCQQRISSLASQYIHCKQIPLKITQNKNCHTDHTVHNITKTTSTSNIVSHFAKVLSMIVALES